VAISPERSGTTSRISKKASRAKVAAPTSKGLSSAWNRVDRNPIGWAPGRVVELDTQIWKIFLHSGLYTSEVLLLALTQFRRSVQVNRHRLVPCAVLMLDQDEPPDSVFFHEESEPLPEIRRKPVETGNLHNGLQVFQSDRV
jgi:hypothetical protein